MHEELKDNLISCLDFFKKESHSKPGIEVVGFLGIKDGKPVAKMVKNRAPDPKNYFAVDPMETLLFKSEHEFLAIFHSHIYGDEEASEWDKATSENCCISFLIYSLCSEKYSLYVPEDVEASHDNLNALKEVL